MALIYVTRKIPDIALEMLRKAGHELVINPKDRNLTKRELVRELRRRPYEGVLCLLTDTVDAEVFSAAPHAKIFSNYAVGFNNVDIEEAKRRSVTIANTPGVLDEAVAEHTVALMLALATRTVEADRFVRRGKFRGFEPLLFLGPELQGKTVAILGMGRIGSRVLHALVRGFSMRAVYYDVKRNEEAEREYGATFMATPEEALQAGDFVSVHVPLLPTTQHLINAARLALMKKDAYLINTSRGPVVDEEALAQALSIGLIKGAALDVFEHEPRINRKLLRMDNVILTPHTASATIEARGKMAELAAEALVDYFGGRELRHRVA